MSKQSIAAVLSLLMASAVSFAETPPQLAEKEAASGVVAGTIDLEAEFPAMKGYVMRQSVNTVMPGEGRVRHRHVNTPEILYIISGVLTEARNDGVSKTYGPGSTISSAAGSEHTWANLGAEPVVFVVTVIRRAH